MTDNIIKKMNFFDGLFLTEEEFKTEQDYHIRLRRQHNAYFHGIGIIEGLEVFDPGTSGKIGVSKGAAINRIDAADAAAKIGQEIVLTSDETVDIYESGIAASYAGDVYVCIAYDDLPDKISPDKGGETEIHLLEKPKIICRTTNPTPTDPKEDTDMVVLSRININGSGQINSIDNSVRVYAGFMGNQVTTGELTVNGPAEIADKLTVKGDLKVEGEFEKELLIKDDIITLNKGDTGPTSDESGLEIFRGTSNLARLIWSENDGRWKIGIQGTLYDLVYGPSIHTDLASGNVGIGTAASSTEKLNVAGNVLIDGTGTVAGDTTIGSTTNPANLTVTGNLDVEGDFEAELRTKDDIITLNKGDAGPTSNESGLEIFRGSADLAQLIWSENENRWKIGIKGQVYNLVYGPNLTADLTSGNLGVGTAPTASEKLSVSGNVSIDGKTQLKGETTIGDSSNPADLTVTGDLTVEGEFEQELRTRDDIITLNQGETGPTSAESGLEIFRGNQSPGRLIWSETDQRWKIGTQDQVFDLIYGRDLFADISAGDVGIGTRSPTEKLDVNGNVRAAGFIGDGSGLTDLDGSRITSGIIPPERLDLVIPELEEPSFGKKLVAFSGYPGGQLTRSFVAANGDVWIFWTVQIDSGSNIWCRRYSGGIWSEDMAVTGDHFNNYINEIIEDQSGNLWLFWHKNTAGAQNTWCSRFDGSGWERATQLTSGTAYKSAQKPIADTAGSIWLFWQDNSDPGRNIWFRKYSDGVWSAARTITGGAEQKQYRKALAGPAGDVWLFWQARENNIYNLWCRRYVDGSWEAATQLSAATSSMNFYEPIADDAGNILVFWQNYGETGRNFSGRMFDGTEWGAEIQMTTGDSQKNFFKAFVDVAGRFWFFWQVRENNVYNAWAKSLTDGSWGADTQLTTGTASKSFRDVFADGVGNVWLFWQDNTDPGRNMRTRRFTGLGWGVETQLTTGESQKDYERSFADNAGSVWFFWIIYEEDFFNLWGKRFSGDAWGDDTELAQGLKWGGEGEGEGEGEHYKIYAGLEGAVWFFWQILEAGGLKTTRARRFINDGWEAENQLAITGPRFYFRSIHENGSGDLLLLMTSNYSTMLLTNSNNAWTEPEYLVISTGDKRYQHSSFADSPGNLWLFWSETVDGARNFWCRKHTEGAFHGMAQLTSGILNKRIWKVFEENQGSVWFFWEVYDTEYWYGNMWCKRYVDDDWSADMQLTAGTLQKNFNWAIPDNAGGVWFFWQVYENNVYNMWCKRFVDGTWEADTQLTSGTASKSFYQTVIDLQNNVWVFWQDNSTAARNFWFRRFNGIQWRPETQLTSGDVQKNYLRSFVDRSGVIWFFWQVYETNVWNMWGKRFVDGSWSQDIQLTSDTAQKYFFTTIMDGAGDVWFFWQVREGNSYNMWCKQFVNDGWSTDIQLTSGTSQKGFQQPIVDADGSIWFFWQDYNDPGKNFWIRQFTGSATGWSAETQITTGDQQKSEPRLFVDSMGYLWFFWRVNENGGYQFWCKRFASNAWQSDNHLGPTAGSLYYRNLLNGGGHSWYLRTSEKNIWSNVNVDSLWISEPQPFGGIESKIYHDSFSNDYDDSWVIWGQEDETGHSIWAKKL